MCSQLAADDPGFFLRQGREESVLFCQRCGNKTLIEHRPWARSEAEAAHVCGLGCGCWSAGAHAEAGGGACGDG